MVCFHRLWRFTGHHRKGGNHLLFQSTTSTHPRIFTYLFAILHVRWLSRVFNCNPCIYHTATRWDLAPYWNTIKLNDYVMLGFICLLDDLMLGFCYSNLTRETGGLELASTITFILQVNRLTTCASHPKLSLNLANNSLWKLADLSLSFFYFRLVLQITIFLKSFFSSLMFPISKICVVRAWETWETWKTTLQ